MKLGVMHLFGVILRTIAALFFVTVLSGSAQARDKDAALVMDASTGKVLYQRNADELRYPASLTKMMTLYMLFEALEAGRVSLSTTITATENAASAKPTRLGLRTGYTLTVEQAIQALVIRSANDAAVAVAEHLAGSEDAFASQMTTKARALGMSRTVFRNASGLPNVFQETTANDMATLGRRLHDDFRKYYGYFAQRQFHWNGRTYRGHNRLLAHFDGADGLKTGYTRLSGYNLATSAMRRGTRLIGVVLGGSSSYSRDIQMADMLETQFGKLGLGRPQSIVVAMSPLVPDEDEIEGIGGRQLIIESAVDSRPETLSAVVAPASMQVQSGPAANLMPIVPRTRADAPAIAASPSAPVAASNVMMGPVVPDDVTPVRQRLDQPSQKRRRNDRRRPEANLEKRQELTIAALIEDSPQDRSPASPNDAIAQLIRSSAPKADPGKSAPKVEPRTASKPSPALSSKGVGVGVQVGALESKALAQRHISAVRSKAGNTLGAARASIVAVKSSAGTKYRTNFGPFSPSDARDICRSLAAKKVSCLVVPDTGSQSAAAAPTKPKKAQTARAVAPKPATKNAAKASGKAVRDTKRGKQAARPNGRRYAAR